MANNPQSITTGEAELKDYYDPYGSMYEAVKRRRKKTMSNKGLVDDEDYGATFEKVPNPDK